MDYETSTLYCDDCDFEMDITQQLALAAAADELDDDN